ncbi:ATP-dependent DNA ligase [Bradyrhizobium sp. USDA 4472]
MRIAYELCLATAGKQVPGGPDWIHEVKHDGYRMLVIREPERVRLLSRNGTDWTKRYPLIAEAPPKSRQKQFVIDGEAVVTAFPISTRCTPASTSMRCSFMPSTFSP